MALTRTERDDVINRWKEVSKVVLGKEGRKLSITELRAKQAERLRLDHEYQNGLPALDLSRCPFTGQVITKTMDPFDLNGPWWLEDAVDPHATGSSHVLCYVGALHFGDREPGGLEMKPRHRIRTGPEVPFVLPRLLNKPGVKCVLSSLELTDERYRAYFMTYFADPPLRAENGHPMWLRTEMEYLNTRGELSIMHRSDAWDFNLRPWISKPGKILWIDPGDRGMKLKTGTVDQCPYVDLPGRRVPLVIREGKVIEEPLPDGSAFDGANLLD